MWYSLCLHRRQCCCRPFRRWWRTLLPYWRATQGGPIRRTFPANNRQTIGGQSGLYRLYYPLCASSRIDTWQIVYLSYKDPCPIISIHKRYIHVPWTTMEQRANAHGHGSRFVHGSCTDGGALYCLMAGDTGGQPADNSDFTICINRCVYRAELILGR